MIVVNDAKLLAGTSNLVLRTKQRNITMVPIIKIELLTSICLRIKVLIGVAIVVGGV